MRMLLLCLMYVKDYPVLLCRGKVPTALDQLLR
jgi:hypothetical protein